MRGPAQAVLVAAGFAALSLILPPLSYLSAATVSLVTLRKGTRAGALILAVACVAVALLLFVSTGNPWFAVSMALALWLPVWLLSIVLRATVSLAVTIQAATLAGALLVIGLHLFLTDPVAIWQQALDELFGAVLQQAGVAEPGAKLQVLANIMTGVVAATMVVSYLFSLLIARWWQAALYHPGGFRQEFHQLRLGSIMAIASLGVLIGAWLISGGFGIVLRDLGTVVLVVYLFQGLAVVHGVVGLLQANVGWLVGVYILTLFALPQLTILLAVTGMVDTWVDVRARLARRGTPGGAE